MTNKEMLEGYQKYSKLSAKAKETARQLAQARPETRALIEIFDTIEKAKKEHPRNRPRKHRRTGPIN